MPRRVSSCASVPPPAPEPMMTTTSSSLRSNFAMPLHPPHEFEDRRAARLGAVGVDLMAAAVDDDSLRPAYVRSQRFLLTRRRRGTSRRREYQRRRADALQQWADIRTGDHPAVTDEHVRRNARDLLDDPVSLSLTQGARSPRLRNEPTTPLARAESLDGGLPVRMTRGEERLRCRPDGRG